MSAPASRSRPLSYTRIALFLASPPNPLTHATLDRVWARKHCRGSVKNAQACPKVGHFSHHIPLLVELALKAKKQLCPQSSRVYNIHKLKEGPEAKQLCESVRERMLKDLPDPLDTSLTVNDMHGRAIRVACDTLEALIGKKKKADDEKFKKVWISDRTKDMFNRAEAAVAEGALSRARELYTSFHKMSRADKRERHAIKIGVGEWIHTRPFRKQINPGSACVRDFKGVLQSSEQRAHVFREKLEKETWRPTGSPATTIAEIPHYLQNLVLGDHRVGPNDFGRPLTPNEVRVIVRKLRFGRSSRPTGIPYEIWRILADVGQDPPTKRVKLPTAADWGSPLNDPFLGTIKRRPPKTPNLPEVVTPGLQWLTGFCNRFLLEGEASALAQVQEIVPG